MTGDVKEAILEMYLSGSSTRKVAGITDALRKVRVSKDAASRIASRLEDSRKNGASSHSKRRLTPTSTRTPPT
jgi:transposase-like protein